MGACGAAPVPAPTPEEPAKPAARASNIEDDCATVPGKPPPEPLERKYEGVAAGARCQREVYTIMGGVTHFLGVQCEYCHVKDDFRAMTHRKAIANWMARELIPSLEKKDGGAVWCNDCHVVSGKGKAKILGNPRNSTWAVEWMTTHLTDDFQRATDDKNLRCKDCHGANLGTKDFRRKIILTDSLPPRPPKPEGTDADAGTSEPDAGAAPLADAGATPLADAGASDAAAERGIRDTGDAALP
jgi:hypothetical protein